MPRYLKRGMDASAIKAADAKVRETVESILAQIEERGDAAVRALSEQFDKWSPQNFKLTAQEVDLKVLSGEVAEGDTVVVDADDGEITFQRSPAPAEAGV